MSVALAEFKSTTHDCAHDDNQRSLSELEAAGLFYANSAGDRLYDCAYVEHCQRIQRATFKRLMLVKMSQADEKVEDADAQAALRDVQRQASEQRLAFCQQYYSESKLRDGELQADSTASYVLECRKFLLVAAENAVENAVEALAWAEEECKKKQDEQQKLRHEVQSIVKELQEQKKNEQNQRV